MCLVNQGGTNHNCCTERLVILCADLVMDPDLMQKNQASLTYFAGQNPKHQNVVVNKPAELGCLFVQPIFLQVSLSE